MKYLFLSETNHKEMFNFLKKRGNVVWKKEKLTAQEVKQYEWVISYGYRHIFPKEIIQTVRNPIINLHISYLPFNRGAHPNYWSFKDDTTKGVTIHFIDSGIDTGPILVQTECSFSDDDTLQSSYLKLKFEIENLFYNNFDKIINGEIFAKPQIGIGTFHEKKELPSNVDWNTNIKHIK